jgi:hypothetical protein
MRITLAVVRVRVARSYQLEKPSRQEDKQDHENRDPNDSFDAHRPLVLARWRRYVCHAPLEVCPVLPIGRVGGYCAFMLTIRMAATQRFTNHRPTDHCNDAGLDHEHDYPKPKRIVK